MQLFNRVVFVPEISGGIIWDFNRGVSRPKGPKVGVGFLGRGSQLGG